MSNLEIQHLEAYLFSENKEEYLKNLLVGSDIHYFLTILTAFNKYGANYPENIRSSGSDKYQNIIIKKYFFMLEKVKDNEDETKKLLGKINDEFLHFRFKYAQPADTTAKNLTADDEVINITSSLKNEEISIEKYLANCYESYESFCEILPNSYNKIDFKKLEKCDLKILEPFLKRINYGIKFGNISLPKLIKIVRDKQSYKQEIANIIDLKFLTLEQMLEVSKLIPESMNEKSFVSSLMIKKFKLGEKDHSYDINTNEGKLKYRSNVFEIYNWSKTLSKKFVSLTNQILFEILQIGIETQYYDFDLFITYLQEPKAIPLNFNTNRKKNYETQIQSYDSFWHSIHGFDTNRWLSNDKLIDAYLEHYFKIKEKIAPFEEYFEKHYLEKIFYTVQLYKGKEVENLEKIFTSNEIKKYLIINKLFKSISNGKVLEICAFNNNYFVGNNEVKLFVEIKNIQQLTINIFEFCPEAYYLKNNKQLDPQINLDGLIASETKDFEFTESPSVKIFKEFKFDSISQKKQGVFIIELFGNGLSSRAVITKGKLIILEKMTLAGQQFTIVDENYERCTGKRVGLWIDKRFFKANEKGEVIVPFAQRKEKKWIIVVNDDYAELQNLEIKDELYNFYCPIIYSKESLLMGKQFKVILQPRLYINGIPSSLDIIENQCIEIQTITDSEVPNSLKLDKIKFETTKDLEIEIPIPPKLTSLSIEIKGDVKAMTKDKQSVKDKHNIEVNDFRGKNLFCEQYLRYTSKGYEYVLLGKNGEKKANIIVNFSFRNEFVSNIIEVTMKTDLEGKISLGHLKNILNVKSWIRCKEDISAEEGSWNLKQNCKVKYPELIHLCKGDSYSFPLKEVGKVQLYKLLKGRYKNHGLLEDSSKLLVIKNNFATLTKPEPGNYMLIFENEENTIEIEVHEGKYYNNNSIILQDGLLNVERQKSDLFVEKCKMEKEKIVVEVFTEDPENTRVNLFGFQFLPRDVNSFCKILRNGIVGKQPSMINWRLTKNSYLSNKSLGDEYVYVLERKKLQRYVGNALERPQILLNRTEIRETSFESEILQGETAFLEKNDGKTEGFIL